MNKLLKIALSIGFCLMFCCLSIGYAALQDDLTVTGTVSYNAPDSPGPDPSLNPDDGSEPEEGQEVTSGNYYYKYSKKDGLPGWRAFLTKDGKKLSDPGPYLETLN